MKSAKKMVPKEMVPKEIRWVCHECGMEVAGRRFEADSTWHIGECDLCHKEKPVTEFRDYFWGARA